MRYYLVVRSKEPRLCEHLLFTEIETQNLKQGHKYAALSVRIAVVASALISIFKWTQFLFESELKVKQLSRRMRERGKEGGRECEEESDPDDSPRFHFIAPPRNRP